MNMQLFTSLEGRISRQPFWLGFIVLLVVSWVLQLILFGVFGASMMPTIDPNADPAAAAAAMQEATSKMMLPLGIVMLLTLWPSICLYAKRWHDRNKSGWWSLIGFIPIIGGLWMLIELGFLRGTEGPNRFGADPLADR